MEHGEIHPLVRQMQRDGGVHDADLPLLSRTLAPLLSRLDRLAGSTLAMHVKERDTDSMRTTLTLHTPGLGELVGTSTAGDLGGAAHELARTLTARLEHAAGRENDRRHGGREPDSLRG